MYSFVFIFVLNLIKQCDSDSTLVHEQERNLSLGICHVAQQEAVSMGLTFKQSKILPLKVDSSWSKSLQLSLEANPNAVPFQSHPRGVSVNFAIWPNSRSRTVTDKREVELPSLCNPYSSDQAPQDTCCTAELELQLLRRTTEELHESLSTYLSRWSSEVAKLRLSLREEVFQTLEQFRVELNRTLCNQQLGDSKQKRKTNCTEVTTDLFPKFRLMIEQFIVGQGDLTLDISIPIDNLLMQLLIDFSCQSTSETGSNTLEAFNEEIRCHKYCQARLNLILDSLMSNTDPSIFSSRRRRRHAKFIRSARSARGRSQKKMTTPSPNAETPSFAAAENMPNPPLGVDQYRLLYSPELLFTIRLNRILMQALELGESLLDGLKDFNAAQGLCMQKLMRMHHCALCAGETLTRPCPELCLTITSSCLQPLSELHTPWKRFTDTIKIAANTFLDKPELSMMVQFRLLPGRLIAYFRHLLKTHKDWLQPQCAGTQKLLEILGEESLAHMKDDTESISKDAASLQSYRKLLQHMKRKMDQMANLWTRTSSALCSESPHLTSSSKNPEQCWNGTAKGRFHFDRCDFCDQPKTSSGNGGAKVPNALVPPGRRQRTSHIPIKPDYAEAEFDTLSAGSLPSVPYLFNNAIWNSPLEQEKEMATRRANEILVRASRDLQWSTDSFLSELQAYSSIKRRRNDSPVESASIQRVKENNGKDESWVQIPSNSSDVPKSTPDRENRPEIRESLGFLAYGSMLGWDMNDFNRVGQSNGVDGYYRQHQATSSKKTRSGGVNNSDLAQNINTGSDLDDNNGDSSGFQPAWPIYGWSQPDLIPQSEPPISPAPTSESTANIDPSMEGSGLMGNPGLLPSFMEYADYPHLNSFNGFLDSDRNGGESRNRQALGPVEDDEDFEPIQSTSPAIGRNNIDNTKNRTAVLSSAPSGKIDNSILGAEGKHKPTNTTSNNPRLVVSALWLALGCAITVIPIYHHQTLP